MADAEVPQPAQPALNAPLKRAYDDEHAPSVSSPLNPAAATTRAAPAIKSREQREKKDSLKKRESAASLPGRGDTPDSGSKKRKLGWGDDTSNGLPSPVRYNHELPKAEHAYVVRPFHMASREPEPLWAPGGIELKRPTDSVENKKVYRYTTCVADPQFPHMRYYRPSEAEPYGAHMSLEDCDRCFLFDSSLTVVSNEKGWRSGRANVCAREGTFYFEVKILKGVLSEGGPSSDAAGPMPHVRVGWARREAPLDAPVGFDGYSYGITDMRLDPMHKSRAQKYLDDGTERGANAAKKNIKSRSKKVGAAQGFTANDDAREGDVIGLEISLPSLGLHRKVVDGNYNPAVEIGSGLEELVPPPKQGYADADDAATPNIVRDRFPIPYKSHLFFESFDYVRSKGMEAYGDRGPQGSREQASPNHPDVTVRSLPHSYIKVYKNGLPIGTAFRGLMAFLPPASAPPTSEKTARPGLDDGMLGYFPAVSAFAGGVARVNLGPDFWFPPAELPLIDETKGGQGQEAIHGAGPDADLTDAGEPHVKTEADGALPDAPDAPDRALSDAEADAYAGVSARVYARAVAARWAEQVAEDVVADLVDEADFSVQDGA